MNSKKGFVIPLIIAIVAILVVGGVVFVTKNKKVEAPVVIQNMATTTTETKGWNIYTNDKYGYQVRYPTDWAVSDWYRHGSVSFCPPESQEVVNGVSSCKVGETYGKSVYPKAPISILQYGIQDPNCSFGKTNLGIDIAKKFCYNLITTDQKYLAVHNQILSTFKFINQYLIEDNLLKVCPESKVENKMPIAVPPGSLPSDYPPSVYYNLDGKRRELSEFDQAWVKANCNVEESIVY